MQSQAASFSEPELGAPSRARRASRIHRALAILLVVCIVVQVLLAGLSLFVADAWWMRHRVFGDLIGLFVIPSMLVVASAGRLPSRTKKLDLIALGLFLVQGATAAIGGAVAVVHPANALLLFWVAVSMARTRSDSSP